MKFAFWICGVFLDFSPKLMHGLCVNAAHICTKLQIGLPDWLEIWYTACEQEREAIDFLSFGTRA